MPTTFLPGMIVFSRGLVGAQLFRIREIQGRHADLAPISLGGVPQQAPLSDLRRYRVRTTDEVTRDEDLVEVLRVVNPRSPELYQYEVQQGPQQFIVSEHELEVHEGSLAPDPGRMLGQLDAAPWLLVDARMRLLEAFFQATSRSLGVIGYNGARMLPIPHQINAARYAVQFGRSRFLLADEVGLGKTIEAGLIASTLRKYFPSWHMGIFVPESLVAQWAFEMYGKFGKLIFALNTEDFDPDVEAGLILPHYKAKELPEDFIPEIIIVDEAHRVLHDPQAAEALRRMSRQAHTVLLLTATPVSDDSRNLLRLLQMLDPLNFDKFDDPAQIRALQEKQGAIEETLRAIREPKPSVKEVTAAWKQVGVKDPEIDRHLREALANHARRHELHKTAALIVDRYYPGARIIRYRRKFLIQENPMPFRIFDAIEYRVTEEETAVKEAMAAWLRALANAALADDWRAQQLASALIQAVHSSPLAVSDWIALRRGKLEPREGVTADPIRLARRAGIAVPPLENEDALLETMETANQAWFRATRAVEVSGRAMALMPRYTAFLEFLRQSLEQEPDAHILVFTSFEANVHPLFLLVRKALQELAETFAMCGTMSRVDREKSCFEFQEHLGGSILISDELGGEGRNFQFASHIVHFDLPLAPWMVEQRIGRCDRVGRDEELDVDSQVIVGKGQMDEAFLDFFADGIGVFNDSIAPVEGELDAIMQRILSRCIEEGATGVLEEIESTHEALEEARERENKELLVRSAVGVEEAQRIAQELRDEEELLQLRQAVIRYARLFESMVDEQDDNRVAITVGEFHTLHAVPGVRGEMIGYFDRKKAVRHERLDFFSPGHPFVRTLTQTAMTESPDRTAIVRRSGIDRAAVLMLFRIALPPEFFERVRALPVDLQPPLLSKSAALFHTRMVRIVFTVEDGELLPNDQEHAPFYSPRADSDKSLHDTAEELPGIPPDWENTAEDLAMRGYEEAGEMATQLYEQHKGAFEDTLVEAMVRVNPTHDALEADIEAILEDLSMLTVELETAVLLIPAHIEHLPTRKTAADDIADDHDEEISLDDLLD